MALHSELVGNKSIGSDTFAITSFNGKPLLAIWEIISLIANDLQLANQAYAGMVVLA